MDKHITYTLGGIIFSEVNLLITDMLIAGVAFYCYKSLKLRSANKGYTLFFLFTCISAIGSGFGHLLTFYTDQYLKVFSWIFSLLANCFIIQAGIYQILTHNSRKLLYTFSVVKLGIGLILLLWIQKFTVIAADSVVSIALISLPFHFMKWKRTGRNGYKVICLGIVFSMLTAVVGAFNLSISDEWFNQKDINHMIICGGLLLMHKGIKQL